MNQVEEVKNRIDVVDLIGGYVRIKKAGGSFKGLCPFHGEKTPSFTVSPERQMWYCFGCSEGGDVFTFIEKIENIEFADALRLLADKAGVELKREDPAIRSKRKEVYEALELAAQFYIKQLDSGTGQKVIKYLKERGLAEDSIKEWRLGYAPDTWDSLTNFLSKKGYKERVIEQAGLAVKKNTSGRSRSVYDRFRHRIMFPIFDVNNQVVGFSGRTFDKISSNKVGSDAGKYINTPNTSVYDKSRVFYGLNWARDAIKKQDEVIIIEGNIDSILAHQAGQKNVVAVFGTALTQEQFKMVKRYTGNATLCFDNDQAGQKATRRAAEIALSLGLTVCVIELPEGNDAADVIKESKEKWQELLSQKKSFVQFVLDNAIRLYPQKTIEAKKKVSKEVLEAIALLHSPLERDHWVHELAIALGVKDDVLGQELKIISQSLRSGGNEQINRSTIPKTDNGINFEKHLLALLVCSPDYIAKIDENVLEIITTPQIRQVIELAKEGQDLERLLKKEKKFAKVLMLADFLSETLSNEDEEIESVIGRIVHSALKEKLNQIQNDLARAESTKDEEAVNLLINEFNLTTRKLYAYEKQQKKEKAHN